MKFRIAVVIYMLGMAGVSYMFEMCSDSGRCEFSNIDIFRSTLFYILHFIFHSKHEYM